MTKVHIVPSPKQSPAAKSPWPVALVRKAWTKLRKFAAHNSKWLIIAPPLLFLIVFSSFRFF